MVAEEINKLSEQTAENTKSINAAAASDTSNIESAVTLNRVAGKAIERILDLVRDVVSAMDELVSGTSELTLEGGDIVNALHEVSQVTEEVRGASAEINTGAAATNANMISLSKEDISITGRKKQENIGSLGTRVNHFRN